MAENQRRGTSDLRMDSDHLYREDVITDLKVGTIRRLTPVGPDGSPDPSRSVLFVGQTQVMTQAGPIPVDSPIEAGSLREAIDRFPSAINRAIDQMMAEFEELRRREASRIVVPSGAGGKILVP